MDNKECKECRRPFFGRADKKFCSDACRSSFNNRARPAISPAVQQINRVLKKNWEILNELNPHETQKVPLSHLSKRGFDFEFFTQTLTTREGKEYRFCYDMGYLTLGDQWILLVRKKETG
ncbi:hypothetical protein [Marinoscillum sp. MHG1-6]|uniref:hypothetical protein n=1 Tax=Marinoscillum sp. MHG1-6 TaxID=2959627 RepID=UPI0021573D2C|nr:hypothetical protein [Marinoscillum sp. MHG1-6]